VVKLKLFANAVISIFLPLLLIETAISQASASQADLPITTPVPTISAQEPDVIDWSPPISQDSVWLYQGFFPDTAPWVAPGVIVKNYLRDNATKKPTKNIAYNFPGRYPVAYQINKSLSGSNKLILEGRLHSDGAYSDCDSSIPNETTSLSVRNCADEYPNRNYYGYDAHGVSWWAYWGGTKGCPQCSKDAAVQRVAQSLIEVGKRHAQLIDEGAGVTLAGDDY
jgi:hypothetical protein